MRTGTPPTPLRARARRRVRILAAAIVVAAGVGLVGTGAVADGPTTFTNAAPLPVADATDDGSGPVPGAATPYPSTVVVSGMSGPTSDVDVVLHGAAHGIANDLDVLLVAPTGQSLVLASDPGGTSSATAYDGTYTFDDEAAGGLPVAYPIPAGRYRPTNTAEEGPDAFPAPAPAPGSATTLSTFDGLDPNGTWSLYVVDDATGDVGQIAGGWSLVVTTSEVEAPGTLQLAAPTFEGAEGDGTIPVTITRTGGAAGTVSVRVTTGSGTAVPGTDHTPVDEVVSFGPGVTEQTVSVPVLDDDVEEPVVDTVPITLSEPTGGAVLGSPATATIRILDDDGTTNASGITVAAVGPAAPYPSTIVVSGVPGAVADVDVRLLGVSHDVASDLDVLLAAPDGSTTLVLSDVGEGALEPYPDVDLTLDDEAATGLNAPVTSGTYQPTDVVGGPDTFPAPAPAGPHGTTLAALDGSPANGSWSLYVVDDASADAGSISGWALDITASSAEAGGPYSVAEGGTLTLAASATGATGGATFAWDLDGDGGHDDATGATPTLTWAELEALGLGDGPATTTISLEVTDAGSTLSDAADLTVTNVAPTATLANSGPVGEGSPATVTVTAATDPSAADTTAGLHHSYDVDGDGAFDDGLGDGTYAGGTTATTATVGAELLDDDPSRTVTVRTTDKDGGSTDLSTTIAIDNVAPTATLTDDGPVSLGSPVDVTFEDADDPSAADLAAGLHFAVDADGDGDYDDGLGDGTYAGSPAATTATVPASTFPSPGAYTVRGRVIDKDGGWSETSTTVQVDASTPTATLSDDGPVPEGSTATITFSDQADPAPGATFTYDYDLDGDGTWDITGSTSPTATVPASVLDDGPDSVTVTGRIRNQFGGSSTETTDVAVTNVAPTATASNGGPVAEGGTTTVTVDSVTDPSAADTAAGFTHDYDLDGDGTWDITGSTSPTATVPASVLDDGPDTVTVTIRTTDDDGGSSTTTTDVAVTNVAPTAVLEGDSVVVGEDATVTFTDQSDPSTADTAAGFTYDYDLDGDGTWDITGSTSPTATVPASLLPAVATYPVTGRITDDDGGSLTRAASVVVVASTPSATLSGDGPVDEGGTATVTFSDQADPASTTFTYDYDLDGDGTWDVEGSTSPSAALPPALTADGPATITVRGRITNEHGGSATLETTVEVLAVGPSLSVVSAPPTAVAGEPHTIELTASDPSPVDAAAPVSYEVDWDGDGTADEVVPGPPAGEVARLTHVFAATGTYAVTITPVDQDGTAGDPLVLEVVVEAAPVPPPPPPAEPPPPPGVDDPPGQGPGSSTDPGGIRPDRPGWQGSTLARTGQGVVLGAAGALALLALGAVVALGARRFGPRRPTTAGG